MTSQRDLDISWLEAMEEIDEVEAEFWETLEGKDAEKKIRTISSSETGRGSAQGGAGGEVLSDTAASDYS